MNASIYLKSLTVASLLGTILHAQTVNSGSDGHDGAFNPTQNITIDMADHPDGIYHYTSVNIPTGVTVTFTPNAKNSPVVWLVQGACVISGTLDVSAETIPWTYWNTVVQNGGPGGFRGGNGGTSANAGLGPGGGNMGVSMSANASFGTSGGVYSNTYQQEPAGSIYGNAFLMPLLGGSGGGGKNGNGLGPGGGGGGAILIAASESIAVNGSVAANGSHGGNCVPFGYGEKYGGSGAGSGGGIRFIASHIAGTGSINANGGGCYYGYDGYTYCLNSAGAGRVRFDSTDNNFGGSIGGVFTQGFQPIIIPVAGQGIQLAISTVAGVGIPAVPSGIVANPDVVIPAQQSNPIPILVSCTNIPMNSEISVVVHSSNGTEVQAIGINNAGTLAASTATVSLNMPRGGGIIYAKCVSGVAGLGADTSLKELRTKSLAETGWTADGERFAKMEITAALGGKQQIAYLTESGKRFPMPQN